MSTLPEVDVNDCLANLISYEEIASMFQVQKATVWKWQSTDVLPAPAGTIGGRNIWTREAIVAWAQATNRTIIY